MKNTTVSLLLALCVIPAIAQVKVQTAGSRITVGEDITVDARDISTTASGGNTASVTVGGIGSGADVQGVTVINGKVWIDGVEIPPTITRHKAKSGTVYRIERKSGAVSVTSE